MRRTARHAPVRLGCSGTQVKWNRQHEHILATSHGKEVNIWDNRKGSVPVTVIRPTTPRSTVSTGQTVAPQAGHMLSRWVFPSTVSSVRTLTIQTRQSSSGLCRSTKRGRLSHRLLREHPCTEGPAGVITTDYPSGGREIFRLDTVCSRYRSAEKRRWRCLPWAAQNRSTGRGA